ncbi:MAG: hypothetical protein ABI824_05140 [Acidobacteriota bacterium]
MAKQIRTLSSQLPKPSRIIKNSRGSAAGRDAEALNRRQLSSFPIAAIGASAGGLDAFTQLQGGLPQSPAWRSS